MPFFWLMCCLSSTNNLLENWDLINLVMNRLLGLGGNEKSEFCGPHFAFTALSGIVLGFKMWVRFFLVLFGFSCPGFSAHGISESDLVFRRASSNGGHIERRKNRTWIVHVGKKPAIRKQTNLRIYRRLRLRRRKEFLKFAEIWIGYHTTAWHWNVKSNAHHKQL